MPRPVIVLLGLLALVLTACVRADPTASPTTASPTASASAPPTASVPAAADPSFAELTGLELTEPTALSPAWREVFALPYGDAPGHLGTSLGGDGEGIQWGPSYGTQMPDGTWWFLDAAHLRLAQFSDTGEYLSEVVLPAEHLTQGQYFQYQAPQAMADGTLVLSSTSPDAPGLLLLSPDRTLTRVPLARWIVVRTSDGSALYGFDEDEAMVRVTPATGAIEPATGFAGQTGDTFALAVDEGLVRVTRPGVDLSLAVTSPAHPGAVVHPRVDAALGSDGVLAVLVVGMVEEAAGDISEVAGLLRVDRDGRGALEPVRALSSESDPADGSQVGVRIGDSRPWLMFVDTDAVRVFRREG